MGASPSRHIHPPASLRSAFVKEDLGMFPPPCRPALPIFTDEDTKPHAGATVAVLATFTQQQHSIPQFVAHYPRRWWWGDRDRRRSPGSAPHIQ